jgi:hypothetical protein
MSETIALETGEFLTAYAGLWERSDADSFFRSPAHLTMICEFTSGVLGFVVLARNGAPLAALPFVTKHSAIGSVINSLPYFGTCSSVVGTASATNVADLVQALLAYARAAGVAAVTLVDDWRSNRFADLLGADFVTSRSNQFVRLRDLVGRRPIESYHQKTRNMVRKAEKLGLTCRLATPATADADIDGLAATHRENMANLGGIAKPDAFFNRLRDPAQPLGPHALYVAMQEGRACGYLLNFYCGDTVEYYMPAVPVADRFAQPLSLLIDQAITDAVADGFAYLNFGGTWPTQTDLRHFKIRWGSSESTYCYYTYILDSTILGHSREALLNAFPYFFVAPFDRIAQGDAKLPEAP